MFNFKFESNSNKILAKLPTNLKLKQNILDDIAEIIRKNIEYNIQHGVSPNGSALKPNKRGTRLFYNKGVLFSSVMSRKYGSMREIYIANMRSNVAKHLYYGTSKMPPRPFFGIGDKMRNEVREYLKNKKFNQLFEMK